MRIYDDSKTFIVDEQVESFVASVKAILTKDSPYTEIPRLPELLDKFRDAYMKVLTSMEAPIREAVDEAKERVTNAIGGKPYKDEMGSRSYKLFKEIYEKLSTCNNVAVLQNIKVEADALKVRLLNEIAAKDNQLAREQAEREQEKPAADTPAETQQPARPAPKVKISRSISIKNINVSNSWQIETPQDVDKYIAALRERILKELKEDTVINIEF